MTSSTSTSDRRSTPRDLPPSTLAVRDLVAEAFSGVVARPGRTLLTVLGTMLGISALVSTLGLAKTAGSQIVERFDVFSATSVVVTNESQGGDFLHRLPLNAEQRLARLNGVNAAGAVGIVDVNGAMSSSVPIPDPSAQHEFHIPVYAASPGIGAAVDATLITGRWFDQGNSNREDGVAVLGPGAAQRLNITRVDQQPVIFIGQTPFIVVGVVEATRRLPELLNAIIIPEGTATVRYDYQTATKVQIDVEIGAAELIAEQAPVALNPNDPGSLSVEKPPEPEELRERVEQDVNALFIILGGVALLVGAIGIANVTLVSVLERVGEIGLRRALGASQGHIAAQFILEAGFIGVIGGVVGTSLGVLIVVVVAATRIWTPILDPWVPIAAPILGALIGIIAGLYPAYRAASMQPVDALRAT